MSLESNMLITRDDKATPYFEDFLYDVSRVGESVSSLTVSTVSVDSADATDLASVITLANELKADVNTLVTDLNTTITQFNSLLTSLREAGKIDS